MKTVDNYKNFVIKISKLGNYFAYPDINLREYAIEKFGKYDNIETAKSDIDKFWEDFYDDRAEYNW